MSDNRKKYQILCEGADGKPMEIGVVSGTSFEEVEAKVMYNYGARIPSVYVQEVKEDSAEDNAVKPNHYLAGTFECIEVMKANMSKEGYEGFLEGSAFKYLWRHKKKNGLQDLKKAEQFVKYLISSMEESDG